MSQHDSVPLAVGGLGGSGTRVFASLLMQGGVDIGTCLNAALDNRWFTVLFKREDWTRLGAAVDEVDVAIDLFCRAMKVGLAGNVSDGEEELIRSLGALLPPTGNWRTGARTSDAIDLLGSTGREAPGSRWGWKEPNTHLFLPRLAQALPTLRYIHVVRDPLDMAFSGNRWQLRHWGQLFGVADDGSPEPVRQTRYWIEANRRALEVGQESMSGRFLAVSYEEFCRHPEELAPRLLRFCGLDEDATLPVESISPSTIGRSSQHDLSIFSGADLERAQQISQAVAASTHGEAG